MNILIRRSDLPAVIEVMQKAGFIYNYSFGVDMFLDGPEAGPRDAVHVILLTKQFATTKSLRRPTLT